MVCLTGVDIAATGKDDGQAIHLGINRGTRSDVVAEEFRVVRRRIAAGVVPVVDRIDRNRLSRFRHERTVLTVDKEPEHIVELGVREVAILVG